jgi:hypothetical protein
VKLNVRECGLQEVTFSLRQVAAHFLTGCIRHVSLITGDEVMAPPCVPRGAGFESPSEYRFFLEGVTHGFSQSL